MGGRGAASGLDPYEGRNGQLFRYGDEFKTLWQDGKVKYVTPRNEKESIRVPEETRTPDRIYATIDKRNRVKYITYYDAQGKKAIQIDLQHKHKGLQPHAHDGTDHGEGRELNPAESLDVETIIQGWEEYNGK